MENPARQPNITILMEERLPPDLVDFIREAGVTSEHRQQRLYLVGGAVRDLLLGRETVDIDLVVEGNAIALAEELAGPLRAALTSHRRFGTATLKWRSRSVDIASARAETYARPGALPQVRAGTLRDDLARRDFAVNAMAVEVNPRRFGDLIDPHDGRADMRQRTVRVLHEQSFTDDATRIWRALRYERRLDFDIEPMTLLLLERDLPMLQTISGTRIRHELELVLKEDEPEKALTRAAELGVLGHVHPALTFDREQAEAFVSARQRYDGRTSLSLVYLALLCRRLTTDQTEELVTYLRPSKTAMQVLRETAALQNGGLEALANNPAPSHIDAILTGYGQTALQAAVLGNDPVISEQIELYLDVLRYVKPSLSGNDLKQLGVPEGARMKEILHKLREARLDGTVTSKIEEEAMVGHLINEFSF